MEGELECLNKKQFLFNETTLNLFNDEFIFGGDQRKSLFLNRKISRWIFYADSVLYSFVARRE